MTDFICTEMKRLRTKLDDLEKRLGDIHCHAEHIIDEIEGTHNHNDIDNKRPSDDYMLEQAGQILDIALN